VAQRFISDTPHEIANFLRVYKNKFDAGEYDIVMMMMMMMMYSEKGDDDEDYHEDGDKVVLMIEWVM
jgi:DhnA family fructose-bisphosphate aldolase class Ia